MYDVAKIYYEFGEIEGIKVMLADGLDINAQDALGRTLLMLAAAEGHFDTVKFLVEHGADVNPQKYKGKQTLSFQGFVAFEEEVYGEIAPYYTPDVDDVVRVNNERVGEYYSALAYACQYSNFEIAKYLVLKGAKIIREPGKIVHGFTALDYSIVKQSEEGFDFLRFLKNQGTDLTNAVYALHIACKFNDLETAKILLGAGIDINMQDECGRTALCFISRPKEGSYYDTNSELIDFFLEKGADINLQDDAGMTFFMYFCRAENLENIKRIYKYVTDVNLEDKVGRTALTHACYSQYDYKIADFLIEQGAKIETEKQSALYAALRASHYAMFSILLDKGANVAFHTKCSYDVFDEACFFLEYDFINRMLQKGEDINRRDETGQTHLMKFCGGCCSLNVIVYLAERGKQLTLDELKDLNWVNGFNKMVKYLIKNGADVNAVDEFGWTALMHICARGCKEIAETLLENGANVNAQNACGGTALMNACSNGNNLELIKLLLDSGADVNLQDEDGDTALMNLIRCAGGETGFGLSIEEYVQRGFHTDEYEDDSEAEKIEHERLMEAIKALLAKGADVTLKNKAGQNALDLIRSKYENSTYYSRCSEISDILNEAWIKQKKAQLEAQKKDYRKQQSKKKHLKITSRRKPKSK